MTSPNYEMPMLMTSVVREKKLQLLAWLAEEVKVGQTGRVSPAFVMKTNEREVNLRQGVEPSSDQVLDPS